MISSWSCGFSLAVFLRRKFSISAFSAKILSWNTRRVLNDSANSDRNGGRKVSSNLIEALCNDEISETTSFRWCFSHSSTASITKNTSEYTSLHCARKMFNMYSISAGCSLNSYNSTISRGTRRIWDISWQMKLFAIFVAHLDFSTLKSKKKLKTPRFEGERRGSLRYLIAMDLYC